jgi:putative aldouronate transport system substrate-binding protein
VEGYDGVKRTLATSGHNGFFAVTKAASTLEDVKRCLDFLDKMNDPDMMLLADNGLEGRHYTFSEDGKLIRSMDLQLNLEYNDLNQLETYSAYNSSPNVTLMETELMKRQMELYEENKQYCVKNPVLPFIQDSPTYMRDGEMLDRMLADARVRYIIGEIDEEELEQLWDTWREMGGSQLIEEVNALYKVRR